MGLATWLLTVIAERLNRTRIGDLITTGVATIVIAWAIIVALLLITLTVAAALGDYP